MSSQVKFATPETKPVAMQPAGKSAMSQSTTPGPKTQRGLLMDSRLCCADRDIGPQRQGAQVWQGWLGKRPASARWRMLRMLRLFRSELYSIFLTSILRSRRVCS